MNTQAPRITVITPSIRPEGVEVVKHTLEGQTLRDFEWIPKLSVPGPVPDLCRSCNDALRDARGELIVFVQDYIKLAPDALQRAWMNYKKHPNTAFTSPVGKTFDWISVVWEWRKHTPIDTVLEYYQWEIDFGYIAKSAILEVGGFDEDYDSGFGWENVDLAYRLSKMGVEFRCDPDNLAVALDHDRFIPHPYKPHPNRDLWIGKQRSIDGGVIRLPHLQ
jgi:hypothetical protein